MSGSTQRSAVALRSLILGFVGGSVDGGSPSDSLINLNANELPDGALIFVLTGKRTYRYDRTSTVTPTSFGGVVQPNAGPGRYIELSSTSDRRGGSLVGTATLAGSSAFSAVQNTWIAPPTLAGAYAFSLSDYFVTAGDNSPSIVYDGPSASAYLVTATATVSSATAADVLEFAISQNGTLVGTTTFSGTAGNSATDTTTAALGVQLVTSATFTLTNGNTLLPVVRNLTGAHNLLVSHINVQIQPL